MPRVSEEEVMALFKQGFGYRTRDGKRILDADSLLLLAGRHGLKGVKTELLHYNYDQDIKAWRCVVRASVEFDGEVYQALADLTDRDVQHSKYLVRVCETRAVARALRFAFAIPLAYKLEGEKARRIEVGREEIREVERKEEESIVESETTSELEW